MNPRPKRPSRRSGWTIQTPSAAWSARTVAGISASRRRRRRGRRAGATARTISQSAVDELACGCPSRSQLHASSAAGAAQSAAVLATGGRSERVAPERGEQVVSAAEHGYRHPGGLEPEQSRLRRGPVAVRAEARGVDEHKGGPPLAERPL